MSSCKANPDISKSSDNTLKLTFAIQTPPVVVTIFLPFSSLIICSDSSDGGSNEIAHLITLSALVYGIEKHSNADENSSSNLKYSVSSSVLSFVVRFDNSNFVLSYLNLTSNPLKVYIIAPELHYNLLTLVF